MKVKFLFLVFCLFLFSCSNNKNLNTLSQSQSGIQNIPENISTTLDCDYVLKGDKLYLDDGKSGIEYDTNGDLEIKGVDINSFTPLACYSYEGGGYKIGKDKNHIYYNDRSLTGVDISSFDLLTSKESERPYYKDKNHVYIFDEILKDADPNTFEFIFPKNETLQTYSPILSKDKNHVYFSYELIENADVNSFEIVCLFGRGIRDIYISKDKNHIYVDGEVNDNFNLEECN